MAKEPLDEIEIAKFKRMAIDAQVGHFPQHLYGDQSHIDVLAESLEKCVEEIETFEEIRDELETLKESDQGEQLETLKKRMAQAKNDLSELSEQLDVATLALAQIRKMLFEPEQK